jgi:hypothetical protein
MTIIVTHISRNGIVHAADSNLTLPEGGVRTGAKLFKIQRLNSALTITGKYSVGGTPMDRWMRDFISDDTAGSLAGFVDNLRDAMNRVATSDEKRLGYFIHVAGYAGSGQTSHPEFHKVSNCEIDQQTGDYVSGATLYSAQEPLSTPFPPGYGQSFFNGFPSGRQAYLALYKQMAAYRSSVWATPSWKFRPPHDVHEEAAYLKNDMEHISLLFLYSNYPDPVIGGEITTYSIPCP